jgi:hypothetical protein
MIIINKFILRPLKAIFRRFLTLFSSGPVVRWPSLIKFGLYRRETAFLWSGGQWVLFALILGAFGFLTLFLNPYFSYSLFLAAIHSERSENNGPGLELLGFWSIQSLRSKAAGRCLIYRPNYNKNPVPAGPVYNVLSGPYFLGTFGAFHLKGPYMGLFFIYLGLGILYFQA